MCRRLRRLLTEARERHETFELTYTVLGHTGDEAWRRKSVGLRTVTLREHANGARECSTACTGMLGVLPLVSCACDPSEYALMPPPGWLPTHLLIQLPYPALDDGQDEIVCFGP